MNNNRAKLLIQLHKSKNTYVEYFETARKLLVDCRDLGAIPFSSMARLAFISSILMRGLKDDSNLISDSINDFLTSTLYPLDIEITIREAEMAKENEKIDKYKDMFV